jgi:cellulose synthase/poly-beta-1,6-N-acetylglucosamine synthase-like glycosyltransferase
VYKRQALKVKDPALDVKNEVISNTTWPLVSCLVAVHNEEKIIEQCISSFINATYQNKEIIFVNDASTDSTALILDTYQATGLIKAIHLEKNIGKKRALAKGIMLSKGSIIVFSDSDSIIAPDAISKIVDVFQTDELIGAVSGHCRALNAESNLITRIQDSWYEGQFAIRKAFESIFGCVTCVSGPLAAFRREAIFNLIPAWEDDKFLGQEFKFATDRTLTGFVLGSQSIGNKLKKKYAHSPFVKSVDYPCRDWKVVYSKSTKALTEVPDTFQKLIKQQIRWKKSFIRNIFFTGYFYWKKPLLPAFVYYIHILFVLMGPFIAFRHLVYLPMHGNLLSLFLYVGGVFFIGSMFGLAYKFENSESKQWVYRPLMSLLSTFILSWLIFYSLATIRKMVWSRA